MKEVDAAAGKNTLGHEAHAPEPTQPSSQRAKPLLTRASSTVEVNAATAAALAGHSR